MGMSFENIERAVDRLCYEIQNLPPRTTWPEVSEEYLVYETVACILGSQVPYDLALAATEEIRRAGILEELAGNLTKGNIECEVRQILSTPIHRKGWNLNGRRFRFYNSRAKQIAQTFSTIYEQGNSFGEWLAGFSTGAEARRGIVHEISGLGPKQASLLLRNIGFSDDLAILDTHVVRYMGLLPSNTQVRWPINSLRQYEEAEESLRKYAEGLGWPMGCLDQAIWIVMRVSCRSQTM